MNSSLNKIKPSNLPLRPHHLDWLSLFLKDQKKHFYSIIVRTEGAKGLRTGSMISFDAILIFLSFLATVDDVFPIGRSFVFILFYNLLLFMRVLYFRIQLFRKMKFVRRAIFNLLWL